MIALAGLLSTALAGSGTAAASARDTAPTIAGQVSATPRLIDQRTNPVQPTDTAAVAGVLGIDGRPTGAALPALPATDSKPTDLGPAPEPGDPNTGVPVPRTARAGQQGPLMVPVPTTVRENFDGVDQVGGDGAAPSDVHASVGPTQIMQAVNGRVTVFTKGTNGTVQCSNSLAGFLGLAGTGAEMSSPRTLYDTVHDRFVIIASPTPTPGLVSRLFMAASLSGNACGAYFLYVLTFTGSLFPLGTLLDYPYLGQDRVSILSSTNNFNPGYLHSTAWLAPKASVYAGATLSFPVFQVDFSTAPVTVTGVPTGTTTDTFWVAGVPGTGYRLYRHPTAGGPIVLQATIGFPGSPAAPYAPPPRRVNQCDTTVTLDPLDGRLAASPVQAADEPLVWFTHGVNISGFPGIRYGVINTALNTISVAVAFHSPTSDDFNPSLGVFEVDVNDFHIWLNWAYTDNPPGPCTFTSATVNGVGPGQGVPNLIGTDRTLATGVRTTTNSRFGRHSSVALDPTAASATCPAGRTALLAQQYFLGAAGLWATRLSRVSFGPGC